MKIRLTVAVGLIALGLLLAARPVGAQTPVATATPLPLGTTTIPEQAPANWRGTQGEWTALRQHCNDIFADLQHRGNMSAAQRKDLPAPSYSRRDFIDCANLSLGFRPPDVPHGPVPPAISPVPQLQLPRHRPARLPRSLEGSLDPDPAATGPSFSRGHVRIRRRSQEACAANHGRA